MTSDLFDKRSAKDKLWDFMLTKHYIRTSDVLKWGAQNYFNRALRTAQELCREHSDKIRRLTDQEVDRLFGGQTKEGVWMIIK